MSSPTSDDRVFKALAHSRRRELLDRLKDHPQTTGALR
ncbi:MAG: transcriptional regulator, partial [Mesorhizobium sp.]